MHGGHPPLKGLVHSHPHRPSHSSGVSAPQLQAQLGLGGYKSAWLMRKLRRAMVDPERSLL